MERTIFLPFLCTAIEGFVGKHLYFPLSKSWHDAQAYCREQHTDLSFVGSKSDEDKLRTASGTNPLKGWIGLYRDPNNITLWKWSGGGYITYQNWASGQPDNFRNTESHGHIFSDGKWNDADKTQTMPFYCIHINTVGQRKSWEEALEHCRESQTTLTSLLSETELLLAQAAITERVWIGLRYLGDHWLWINNDPLVYQAWSKGGIQDQQCPKQNRCGVLTKDGLWEEWDCQDRLNFICN
ncbi:hypothetical protein PAMA_016177 [Pampus argenteus]